MPLHVNKTYSSFGTMATFIVCLLFLKSSLAHAQSPLTKIDLETTTIYFDIDSNYQFDNNAKNLFQKEVSRSQFIGLAELHQSQQLSLFTNALLNILNREGFKYFAMELGPYSAKILSNLSAVPNQTADNIKKLNTAYGNKLYQMTPLVFADRKEDALFIENASKLGFEFWGLDQEFIFSYEMHLDTLYSLAVNKTEELQKHYLESKTLLKSWGKKAAKSSKFDYNCQLQEDPTLQSFFQQFEGDDLAKSRIEALRTSWDIYCKNESGLNSNQQRADYMKKNFDNYFGKSVQGKGEAKVFVKLGNVHLTKGKSPFGVDDMGKYLSEKAEENDSGFLNIRHLARYRNGKDLIGKKGWESVTLFMELGKKDVWTLIDLRPILQKLRNGELQADKSITFEINSYDMILIPPNDQKSILNF